MKKLLTALLIFTLCFGMTVTATGCGKSEPYSKYDLTEYIKLPDYNSFETTVPEVKVSDEDIEKKIQTILEGKATTDKVTEGKVAKGDTVTISFKGTLEDGSSPEGMNSEGYDLALGSGGMIDGFEEAIYGATIGEPVKADLKFPDPYQVNEELSGKPVTFEITVLSKNVKNIPELNEAFVKENSESATVEEFKETVKKDLEQEAYDKKLYEIKSDLYNNLVEKTEVLKYPEKEVEKQIKELDKSYKQLAKTNNMEWDEYRDEKLKVDQEGYDEQLDVYARELVKQEMIIYLIAKNEELNVTDEEYDTYLDNMVASSGFKDEAAFKSYTGMSVKEYAEAYRLDRDLLLTKELDKIYERLTAEAGDK